MTATPDLTITPGNGFINIEFDNPDSPTANYLDRTLNGVTVRLTKTLGVGGTFADYTAAAATQYTYSGIAVDGSGNESTPSSAQTGETTVDGCSLFKVMKAATTNKNGNYLELFNLEGGKRNYQRDGEVLVMPARVKPVIKMSPVLGKIIEVPIIIPNGQSSMFETLEDFIASNDVFCYRDSYGEVMFCTIPPQRLELDLNNQGVLVLAETDYPEEVAA